MIEVALGAFLKADAGIAALAAERVYAQQRPQSESHTDTDLPALVFTKLAAPRNYHLRGQTNLVFALFQLDFLAASYEAALLLAEAARNALSGFRGTMGEHRVTSTRVSDTRDLPRAPDEGSEDRAWGVTSDVRIGFKETVPTF